MYSKALIFFLLFLGFGNAVAQNSSSNPEAISIDKEVREPLHLDKNYIEELKTQDDFYYIHEIPQESWWSLFKKWISNLWNSLWEALFGDLEAGPFLAFILELLPYLVLAGILVLIVWLFIKLNPGASFMKKTEAAQVYLTEDEEIIQSQDINKLIQKAKAENNYRLAIRYYYLLILKSLSDKEIVNFKAEKTNEDYTKEIANTLWQAQFKKLTHLYDFIWYGNFSVSENDFFKAESEFKEMQTNLQNHHNE